MRFTIMLMGRAVNRQLYNSLEHLSNFLGSFDDHLAAAALECVAAAVASSRLQSDYQTEVHFKLEPLGTKLLALAEGWSDRSQVNKQTNKRRGPFLNPSHRSLCRFVASVSWSLDHSLSQ